MEANSKTKQSLIPGPAASSQELREAALKEAKLYEHACKKHDKAADKASWTLVYLMLRVLETFEQNGQRNEAAFEAFLTTNRARKHGNSDTEYHRLAKACTPKEANSSRVSKLGGAIAALRARGIGSATVEEELKKRLPVEDGGERHGGVHRFFLLYQKAKRDKAKQDKAEQEQAGTTPPNPYANLAPERLVKQAKLLLQALKTQNLLPEGFEGLEAALALPEQPSE
ncbi:hypothetical protein [Methylobacterium dankookense]|uniref:Uncharacterized protein n=3 Tax=Methylobacterium dankookense TaxID=560405 RepID=A0ABQ4RBG6_9HYPH|nr:hypothetical protein [Methylobacterium dankookense]GJD54752.1 hypothetical protein IFDJLNFL_0631 [Methylobacterium dankookense]